MQDRVIRAARRLPGDARIHPLANDDMMISALDDFDDRACHPGRRTDQRRVERCLGDPIDGSRRRISVTVPGGQTVISSGDHSQSGRFCIGIHVWPHYQFYPLGCDPPKGTIRWQQTRPARDLDVNRTRPKNAAAPPKEAR